jgi:isoleucyl-tRNA synthetase
MELAQEICSMVLSLRKKSNIRVRQPLGKIMIPVLETSNFVAQVEKVKDLILHEVNVKEIQFIEDTEGVLVKKIKPDFKTLGPRYGKIMKAIVAQITQFNQKDIAQIEKEGRKMIDVDGEQVEILITDVEIIAEDIPGWVVTNQGALTVALDITITQELKEEGYVRELVNRIQNFRKDQQLDVIDNIAITLQSHSELDHAFKQFENYIKTETLCTDFSIVTDITDSQKTRFEIVEGIEIDVIILKSR